MKKWYMSCCVLEGGQNFNNNKHPTLDVCKLMEATASGENEQPGMLEGRVQRQCKRWGNKPRRGSSRAEKGNSEPQQIIPNLDPMNKKQKHK